MAEETNTAQVSWAHSDHQGSIRDWTNQTGTILRHIRYSSYGRITVQSGTLSNQFWYTGREWDGEIGLYFYRARYYDPAIGQFISEDPIGFGAGDANLYRYVRNRCNSFTDPTGLQFELPISPNDAINTANSFAEEAREVAKLLRTRYGGWKNVLPTCPCTEVEAKRSSDFQPEGKLHLGLFHPGAASSYRSTPREYRQGGKLISKPGQQCTYNPSGKLITSGAGAGTPDFWSPAKGLLMQKSVIKLLEAGVLGTIHARTQSPTLA